MSLALIAALPFAGALLPGLMIRAGRNACAASAGAVTALALLLLLLQAPAVLRGEVVQTRLSWMPGLGLDATFFLDGLGLLFAGLILGIGLLVILYARFYLDRADPMGRFYTFLLLFQGAMTGIVLSDNILLLLIFWELTSLTSFLLIGYWQHKAEGRQGARMALAVTGGGGLALIAGMLILGGIAGSYDLTVILTKGEVIRASEWYLPALILMLLGAFTKSAQFPFHFWLPHAMAAPTPVSAYLHSATMVKAGLFLMARLWPVLSGTEAWVLIVTTAGLVTMVIGALIALFKDDLKAILAFSTVSHLGLVTMLLGMGTASAATAALFHIIAHATFKCALFMAAGIVDHETGTRDIRRLGGLRRLMPVTFAIVAVAALSMAGLPPLNGFLSKEMMLEEATHAVIAGPLWLVPALATVGAAVSVAYCLRLIWHGFLGPVRHDYPHPPHDPGPGLWAAPGVMAVLVVVTGLFPMTLLGDLVAMVAGAVTGAEVKVKITHWHGFVPALYLSVAALAAGAAILALYRPLAAVWAAAPRPEAKAIFDAVIAALVRLCRHVTAWLHDGQLARPLAIAVFTMAGVGLLAFLGGDHAAGTRPATPAPPLAVAGWVVLLAASVALFRSHRDRLAMLILVSVVGLMVSVGFAWASAPDLALTQLAVEVVTVVLMLLMLNFLPRETAAEGGPARHLRDLAIACAAGLGTAALAWAMLTRNAGVAPIADYYLANSKTEGGGNNAVNVIIVDFRGYDTYGEIIVLGIAALIIFALVDTLLAGGPAADRLRARTQHLPEAADRHPMMLVVGTRLLLPVAILIGVYLFLRGHNLPGGGFVAGLAVAIALVMQYMASGYGWTAARRPFDYHSLIGWGVLIAGLTGVGAWLSGMPFLTSAYGYVTVWPLETFEWATAMGFDLGVFLAVLGAVLLALASIARVALRMGERVNLQPFGIDPAREPR